MVQPCPKCRQTRRRSPTCRPAPQTRAATTCDPSWDTTTYSTDTCAPYDTGSTGDDTATCGGE